MVTEKVLKLLEDKAKARAVKSRNAFTASCLSRDCKREIGYIAAGVEGEPLLPRRLLNMETGTAIHGMFQTILKETMMADCEVRDTGKIADQDVRISIDGIVDLGEGKLAVVEFKTMADYSFDRACEGKIEASYLRQAYIYHVISGIDTVIFICFRKETSHLVELVFEPNCQPMVMFQAISQDMKEDAALQAIIKTPFDDSIKTDVEDRIRAAVVAKDGTFEDGVNIVESELHKVQGKEKAEEARQKYGPEVKKGGAWYTFDTGRKCLGFPCSYCGFKGKCFPTAILEFQGGKPKWIIPTAVKADA